jgi:hypothetical protein
VVCPPEGPVVDDQLAVEAPPQLLHEVAARLGVQYGEVGQAQRAQSVEQGAVGVQDVVPVGLEDVPEVALRRDPQPDPLGADGLGDRGDDLHDEAGAVLRRAAVLIGAPVGRRGEELVEQVAVGAVDLHAVRSRRDGPAGRGDEVLQGCPELCGGHRLRHGVGLLALLGERLAVDGDRAWSKDAAAAVDVGVGAAAGVHDLQDDAAALGVHRFEHPLPAGRLLVGGDARLADIPLRRVVGVGALGDDHADARPLPVVLGHEVPGDAGGTGPDPGQRCHDDAVGEVDLPERDGGEQ